MTLDTHFCIIDPVNPERAWEKAAELLGAQEARTESRGAGQRETVLGQGLPAWLRMEHAVDGPIAPTYEDGYRFGPPFDHCVDLSFDTGLGYDRNGANCHDLHAWLVRELAAWCDEAGVRYVWEDECGGGWYTVLDELEVKLGDPERGRLR